MSLGIGKGNIGAASARRLGAISSAAAQNIGSAEAQGILGQGQALGQAVAGAPAALSQGIQLERQLQEQAFNREVTAESEAIREEHLRQVIPEFINKAGEAGSEVALVVADKTKGVAAKIKQINQMIPNALKGTNILNLSQSELESAVNAAQATSGVNPAFAMQLLQQKTNLYGTYTKAAAPIMKQVGPILSGIITKPGGIDAARAFILAQPKEFLDIHGEQLLVQLEEHKDDPQALAAIYSGEQPVTETELSDIQKKEEAKTVGRTAGLVRQELLDLPDEIQKSPLFKKTSAMRSAALDAGDILSIENPIGDASIKVKMARLSGEVGNLSEAEQKIFGTSPQILARIDQMQESLFKSGEMSKDNRDFLRQLIVTMRGSAEKQMDAEIDKLASAKKSAFGNDAVINERIEETLKPFRTSVSEDHGLSIGEVQENSKGEKFRFRGGKDIAANWIRI